MKKLLVFVAVIFALAQAARADSSHDVLAHSSGEWSWFAHITKSTANNPVETPVSGEQTELFIRHSGPGEQWKTLPTLTGRAIVLASRMSQLAVLMNDGQWMTLWADGSATGQPLPGIQPVQDGGRMVTLADDGTDLWAIGSINGGIAAANEALLKDSASTAPTTIPAMAATMPSTSPVQAGLVLFREVDGRWATVAEVPADQVAASGDDLSLSVVGGVPLLTFRAADGSVRTLRFTAEHGWQLAGSIKPATTQPIQNFRVLSDGFKPVLWITTGNDPGELFPAPQEGQEAPAPIKLQWPGAAQLDGIPTATFAGGYICVFGPHDGKVFEQRYKSTGAPFETPAELSAPEPSEGLIPHWLEVVLLAFMGFSVGANVFRQWSAGDKVPDAETPVPAPLLPRFAAGLVDALPVIAAAAFVLVKTNGLQDPSDFLLPTYLIIAGSALALYLLHTTLAELFTGRSAGKWLLGLKVVTVEGNPPTQGQFVMRNLLRIVDPLVMIIFSPLRQRSADTVANTMVVRIDSKPAGSSTDQMKESDAGKTDSR